MLKFMNPNDTNEPLEIPVDEIVAYLQANPDFFVNNKFLLAELNLPHASGTAVSLVERQVDILRERNVVMRKRMNDLLDTARLNDALFTKTRSLTLALLECNSMQALNEVLATHMLADFEADFVCCHLLRESPMELIHQGPLDHFTIHRQAPQFVQLINADKATCTSLRTEEITAIFPMTNTDTSGSAVLIPFSANDYQGTLAIGSREAGYFSGDMDTLFVTYIADILSKVLESLL